MKMVSEEDFGQIFITDTNAERVERIFEEIGVDLKLFHIDKSKISHE